MNPFDSLLPSMPLWMMSMPRFMMTPPYRKTMDAYIETIMQFHKKTKNDNIFRTSVISPNMLPIPYNVLSKQGLEEAQLEYLHHAKMEHIYLEVQ